MVSRENELILEATVGFQKCVLINCSGIPTFPCNSHNQFSLTTLKHENSIVN